MNQNLANRIEKLQARLGRSERMLTFVIAQYAVRGPDPTDAELHAPYMEKDGCWNWISKYAAAVFVGGTPKLRQAKLVQLRADPEYQNPDWHPRSVGKDFETWKRSESRRLKGGE